ncbi:MAG: NYN domain-containing protein [Acidimicrobiia bacterium]
MADDEERIALFLDYENLAIGARDALRGQEFDFKPIADALAERGRVVSRRAYADWSMFDDGRRMLTRHHLELIEIPQRLGASRKNAADIKMAVDAIELALVRDYVTTFVIGTGDSDFTPLVHKLRELNKKVIGVGIKASTSALLPPACDEFLFYEALEGVEAPTSDAPARRPPRRTEPPSEEVAVDEGVASQEETEPIEALITRTLAGLQRSSGESVLASSLKRAVLRKDSTFSEADYGFRAFGELLRNLEEQGLIELSEGPAKGDPVVQFNQDGGGENEAFSLLVDVVTDIQRRNGKPALSGLKNQVRKRDTSFSEKKYGFSGFLQFCKAAATRGLIELEWDEALNDYRVGLP